MICVDANVLIGAISARDAFHQIATEALADGDAVALNITLAEALVRPHRLGTVVEARAILATLDLEVLGVSDAVADRASRLRAEFGNRNLPMVDALVMALGIEENMEIVTADDKWPEIPAARVRILQPVPPESDVENGRDDGHDR